MSTKSKAVDVTIIGGGMITNDIILPSVYHLQRTGVVADLNICALNTPPLRELRENSDFAAAFPGQGFTPYPSLSEPDDAMFPELYKEVVAGMKPRQGVVVAVPDQFHYDIVTEVLACDQHILCVKPLVLKYEQAIEIEETSKAKGLFVGVEYHKRFDRRALLARKECTNGTLGDFVMGEAKLIEPYMYRHSNFQNWFTCDQTDPFVYIGCHYVDQVYYITGLKPAGVSVSGIKGTFPNGKDGYMWSHGRVIFENGGILSVINGLGYPDDAAGSNDQNLVMWFEGDGRNGMIEHDDQFRGVTHTYLGDIGVGGARYNYINPDFFRLVPWMGDGYEPIGYGFDSIAANIKAIAGIEGETADLDGDSALARRREIMAEVDKKGIIATPANSYINELVTEAARLSILNDGNHVDIVYGDAPHVALRG